MKYFLVNLHSKPMIVKISYERYCSLLKECDLVDVPGVDTIFAPYPFGAILKVVMLTDDLLLLKWVR